VRIGAVNRRVDLVAESGGRKDSEDADPARHALCRVPLKSKLGGDLRLPAPTPFGPDAVVGILCKQEQIAAQCRVAARTEHQ
jgi:hypothetical protein